MRFLYGDVVSEDRRGRNDCDGKDTVLFCPMSEGQSATFELTDTMRYCGGTRKLQDDKEEVTEDMRPIRLAKAGIKFYITTPDNTCPNHVSQVTSITQVTIGKDNSKAILDFVHESFGATASVSKISLQHANMEQQMFIAPHMDGKDTALVFLGGSDANVVYLNEKEGNTEAQTYPGKALAHGAYTVHSEYQRHSFEICLFDFFIYVLSRRTHTHVLC